MIIDDGVAWFRPGTSAARALSPAAIHAACSGTRGRDRPACSDRRPSRPVRRHCRDELIRYSGL